MPLFEASLQEIDKLRINVQDFLDDRRLSASQVITVDTQRLPLRVITYQYYGSSERAQQLLELNQDINVLTYEGNIKVVTS